MSYLTMDTISVSIASNDWTTVNNEFRSRRGLIAGTPRMCL